MNITPTEQVPQAPVTMEGAAGCRVRWLVGEKDEAPNFAMREFELDPGGHTPLHFHPYEHEIYVLEGEGAVVDGNRLRPLRPGDVVYVAPNDVHQFQNTGAGRFRMLCLIPNSAALQTVTVVPECGLEPAKRQN
jgi:quercetin dioxygenase-like cupin family protein